MKMECGELNVLIVLILENWNYLEKKPQMNGIKNRLLIFILGMFLGMIIFAVIVNIIMEVSMRLMYAL
jgi:hypothetical protein